MTGGAAGEVLDLLAAGDAHDHELGLGPRLQRRPERTFEGGSRRLVVFPLEAERPRHAAARGGDHLGLVARQAE